jgi:hypothetical protein
MPCFIAYSPLLDLASPAALQQDTDLIFTLMFAFVVQANYSQPDGGFSSWRHILHGLCFCRFLRVRQFINHS